MDAIRVLDILLSILGLVFFLPFILIVALLVKVTSNGPIFYLQNRVGKNEGDFKVFKFRTMTTGADSKGFLTVGGKDNRVTKVGYYLRKFKIDELPQLINVLKGDMSIVGPRPEVRKYVEMYSSDQKRALQVLPGITDYASIAFRNENELLATATNPEDYYIKVIMPKKIELNFIYINNRSVNEYLKIIGKTIIAAVKGK